MTTLEDCVIAGASWLDKKEPGWRAIVKAELLDMEAGSFELSGGCGCICAQLDAARNSNRRFAHLRAGSYWGFLSYHHLTNQEAAAAGFVFYLSNDLDRWSDGTIERLWIAQLDQEAP